MKKEQPARPMSAPSYMAQRVTVEEHLDLYRSCGFAVVELFWLSCMQAGFYCIK
ncbi:MAG: hypothetical protein ABSA18_11850 [Dehalococcoidia bacterium]